MYTIHPTNETIVLTPDNGCIECKHDAAAKRVAAELNERIQEIARLRKENARLRNLEDAFIDAAAAAHARID